MIVGVLLAAGKAVRFGGDKLLSELGDGRCVAEVAAARLLPSVDRLIAIVRPGSGELSERLAAAGAEVFEFQNAHLGMGASLAYGVGEAPEAQGWLIALADMPLVATEDAMKVADAVRQGAGIAIPVANTRRGHPVGFSRQYFSELVALSGDIGARSIISKYADDCLEIPVGDQDSWLDVDSRSDLVLARQLFKPL